MRTIKKILLVEDDELDVISVQRSLKKFAIDVTLITAFNGIEALSILNSDLEKGAENLPEVIILDMNMPKMNGYEFLKELRQDSAFKDIKVFVMTTSNETSDKSSMEKLGISGFILKPMMFTENTKHQSSMDSFMQFHLSKIFLSNSYFPE